MVVNQKLISFSDMESLVMTRNWSESIYDFKYHIPFFCLFQEDGLIDFCYYTEGVVFMGYSIELINRETKQIVLLKNGEFVRSSIVPVEWNESANRLIPYPTHEASLSITYNYANYYYEATDNDSRFMHEKTYGSEAQYGIRGIYAKTASESIPMLKDMIKRIELKYRPHGEWLQGVRKRKVYIDLKTGNRYTLVEAIGVDIPLKEIEETYTVNEGDTSNYWEATAANAILPLKHMLRIAKEFADQDVVWNGD